MSGAQNSQGLLSSLTSFFNNASLRGTTSSSEDSYGGGRRSMFGSGLPTSMRRGPPKSLDDSNSWTLPYSQYVDRSPSTPHSESSYPPAQATSPSSAAYPSFSTSTTTIQAGESTSTLVPGNGRRSMTLSTNVSIPSTAYPPLKHTWRRIRKWCDHHYTELSDTLNWPATEAQLDDLEMEIGFTLPPAVRDSYLCYDGQEVESHQSCEDGLFFGLPLLSLDQVAEEWRFWRSVDDDPTTGGNAEVKAWMNSCPAGWVRHEYSCRGWIPLITDHVGNYVGVDLSPNPNGGGSPGQVILFGRDFDTKIVLWRGEGEGGWGRFLQYIAEELESGEIWSLESEVSSDSNDEEDVIGYEPYFSGTGGGHGGGDRGGDGAAQFKMRGEYKGWPVLEAWADRSMRCWEEIGMPSGLPEWRTDPPTVVLPDQQENVNEDGEALDAESSSNSNFVDDQSLSHPLEPAAQPGTPKSRSVTEQSYKDTLSPPPMNHGSKFKAKQKDVSWGMIPPSVETQSPVTARNQQQRAKKAIPAPAAPLDLPTIDDVRAAHAAALASQRRNGPYHYDAERAIRPPPGMGGMGMGMGMGSRSPAYIPRSAGHKGSGRPSLRIQEEQGVELEARPSAEVTSPLNADASTDDVSHLNDTVVNVSPRPSLTAHHSPSINTGRTLFSPSTAEPHDPLIDASSGKRSEDSEMLANGVQASLSSEAVEPMSSLENNPNLTKSTLLTRDIEAPASMAA